MGLLRQGKNLILILGLINLSIRKLQENYERNIGIKRLSFLYSDILVVLVAVDI